MIQTLLLWLKPIFMKIFIVHTCIVSQSVSKYAQKKNLSLPTVHTHTIVSARTAYPLLLRVRTTPAQLISLLLSNSLNNYTHSQYSIQSFAFRLLQKKEENSPKNKSHSIFIYCTCTIVG